MPVDQSTQKVFPITEHEIKFAAQIFGITVRELEKIVTEGRPLQVKWTTARQFGRQTALEAVQRWREQVGVPVGKGLRVTQRVTGHSLKDQMAHAAAGRV